MGACCESTNCAFTLFIKIISCAFQASKQSHSNALKAARNITAPDKVKIYLPPAHFPPAKSNNIHIHCCFTRLLIDSFFKLKCVCANTCICLCTRDRDKMSHVTLGGFCLRGNMQRTCHVSETLFRLLQVTACLDTFFDNVSPKNWCEGIFNTRRLLLRTTLYLFCIALLRLSLPLVLFRIIKVRRNKGKELPHLYPQVRLGHPTVMGMYGVVLRHLPRDVPVQQNVCIKICNMINPQLTL